MTQALSSRTLVVYSDGPLSLEGRAGYGFAIHRNGVAIPSSSRRLGLAEVFDAEAKGGGRGQIVEHFLFPPRRIMAPVWAQSPSPPPSPCQPAVARARIHHIRMVKRPLLELCPGLLNISIECWLYFVLFLVCCPRPPLTVVSHFSVPFWILYRIRDRLHPRVVRELTNRPNIRYIVRRERRLGSLYKRAARLV